MQTEGRCFLIDHLRKCWVNNNILLENLLEGTNYDDFLYPIVKHENYGSGCLPFMKLNNKKIFTNYFSII